MRFSSLQYLTIHPISARPRQMRAEETDRAAEKLRAALAEAINLDDANRIKLQQIANAEPLALIEYWAVDPDYDGRCSARCGRTTGATRPTMPTRCAW